jgi:integrase
MANVWTRKVTLRSGETHYRVCWRDPAGVTHSTTFDRAEDARTARTNKAKELQDGASVDPKRGTVTLGDFLEVYLDRESAALRPSSRVLYRVYAKHFGTLAQRPLNKIRRSDVEDRLEAMRKAGIGAPTRAGVRRLLIAVLNYAIRQERIAVNPARLTDSPKVATREARYLSADEVERLAGTVRERDRALILLLAWGGLRVGEALALRVDDVEFLRRRVHVTKTVQAVNGVGLMEGPPKTRKSERWVYLPQHILEALSAHVAAECEPTGLLFPAQRTRAHIRVDAWRRDVFTPACKRAKLEPVPHVHDLRHTAAHLMAAAGYSLQEAGAQLGHSNATMTEHYSGIFPETLEARTSLLDTLYRGTTETGEQAR